MAPADSQLARGGQLEDSGKRARLRLSSPSSLSLSGSRPPTPSLRPHWPQPQDRAGEGRVGGAAWRQSKMAALGALVLRLRSGLRLGARGLCARLATPPPRASDQVSRTGVSPAPQVRGPVPGVPGTPPPGDSGTQHLRVLNGTPLTLWGASLLHGVGNTCSPGLETGDSSTSSGLHLLWTPRGCWGRGSPLSPLSDRSGNNLMGRDLALGLFSPRWW